MKRTVTCWALILGLLIPGTIPASATEKCLASFADSEWSNGTPAAVKSLLGFDLVEKKIVSGGLPSSIDYVQYDSYETLGEHVEKTTYSYLGKNCSSREVVVVKTISEVRQSKEKTIESAISRSARNFVFIENGKKLVANVREYFSKNSFQVPKKISLPADRSRNISGSAGNVFKVLGKEADKIGEELALPSGLPMISFPTRCSFFRTNAVSGGKVKLFVMSIRHSGGTFTQEFVNNGECIGELRFFGVEEKIADIRYVVTDSTAPTTIICKKGNLTSKVKGSNSKCPKGYKKA
jgi:hypothetical protein